MSVSVERPSPPDPLDLAARREEGANPAAPAGRRLLEHEAEVYGEVALPFGASVLKLTVAASDGARTRVDSPFMLLINMVNRN